MRVIQPRFIGEYKIHWEMYVPHFTLFQNIWNVLLVINKKRRTNFM
jgi:hypothetical protein